jgi:MFS family permease
MVNLFPLFLILYEFSLYLSNDMYLPAFPSIMQEFAVDDSIVQLTLSSWLLGDGLAQLIFGPLSDRVGRRPVIFGGGVVFSFLA